jgi:hypothetical protein
MSERIDSLSPLMAHAGAERRAVKSGEAAV